MIHYRKLICLIFVLCFSIANAQQSQPEMADVMRSNGKIYVVVGVVLILFVGLFSYLIFLNKKINAMEEKLKSKQ